MIAGIRLQRFDGRVEQSARSLNVRGLGGPILDAAAAFSYGCMVKASEMGIETTLFENVGPIEPHWLLPSAVSTSIYNNGEVLWTRFSDNPMAVS
jgi:hypothetical protein